MSDKDTGGQAFPNEGFNGWGEPCQGMTLRDYFAAKVMQSIVQTPGAKGWNLGPTGDDNEVIFSVSYAMADAMLAERAK